ncbi:MAG: hypothetical protein KGN02_03560 [bacterium]|nr:hypothetical protein [bacterium]
MLGMRLKAAWYAVIVSVLALVAAAPASAIVINNGLIVVHNTTKVPVIVKVLTHSGHEWEGHTVQPGHSFMSERCCYAAGSEYRIYVRHLGSGSSLQYGGMDNNIYFRPELCNRNGIPYGFAEFKVTDHNVNRMHNGCYTGPI